MKKAGILVAAILCCCSFHSFSQQVPDYIDLRAPSEATELSLLQNDGDTVVKRTGNVTFMQSIQSLSFVDIQNKQIFFIPDGAYYDTVIGYQPAAHEFHFYKFSSPDLTWQPAPLQSKFSLYEY